MQVQILAVGKPRKPSYLAAIKYQVMLDDGNVITVDDARILRNSQGILWLAQPTYAVADGRNWPYQPTVVLSHPLRKELEDLAVSAFEQWSASEVRP